MEKNESPPGSARDYAISVDRHAHQTIEDSLYSGENYVILAQYLQQPYYLRTYPRPCTTVKSDDSECFVSLYNLSSPAPEKPSFFRNVEDFAHLSHLGSTESGHMLFMRGNPSPEWLNTIGYKCNVDPEFFLRHLDFRSTAQDYFPLPSLPSSAENIIRLHWTTIGSRATFERGQHDQKEIEWLRQESDKSMREYLHQIRLGHDLKIADSFVRRCDIHDETHLSLEQDVSICLNRVGKSWVVLIWMDVGDDLFEGPKGPWLPSVQRGDTAWTINLYPTIQHKPNMAFKAEYPQPVKNSESNSLPKLRQSASRLYLDYGKTLEQNAAHQDPFNTLNGLYKFTAFSEVQFLNMMETD